MRWPTLRRPAFVTGAVLAAAAALPAFASAATDSTIVYECRWPAVPAVVL